jgi:HK97 family phage major capsid protein
MSARLWGPSHEHAIWLMSNDAYEQIADASFDNGAPVICTGPNGERYIHQMPLELVEYTSELGDVGDVVLADFTQYVIGDKNSEFLRSIYCTGFDTDESVFRFIFRVGGQPLWAAPLTMRNSAQTQSPFVTLASRE